jgi:two-component system, cell cycle sensor histidine kinase and response regulator CckA
MIDVTQRLTDPRRIKQLQVRKILDSPRDETFDRLTRLAAKAARTPVSLITFVDGGRQWFKSSYGLAEPWSSRRETPLSHSFCQYVVAYEQTLVIPDARNDPLVRENLAIPEIGVAAYIGAPLRDSNGMVLGSFAVIDAKPRQWTDAEVEIVSDFAVVAMTEVDLKTESTLRYEAEAALRQAQKMEALGRLAGGIAHDFNNLLTVFHGNIGMLLEDLRPDDPHRIEVHEMQTAADRASQLTAQLLAFSRHKVFKRCAVDLNDLLRNIEPLLRRLLLENIELELRLDPAVGPVFADPGQLEQIVVNLVVNARDAMPDGGSLLIVTAAKPADEAEPQTPEANPRADGFMQLAVEDTGQGMDAETRERIFEPFFTTKEGVNTGLGLSIVYGAVTQLGGRIAVQSESGKGTRFDLRLPTCQHPAVKATKPRVERADLHGSETVLVVEDEAAVRTTVERILRHWGYRVISAECLDEAVDAWRRAAGAVDLLVTDVVLRGESGARVAERLRTFAPALPVLYMSGHADDVVFRQLKEDDRSAFLEKPFTPVSLGNAARRLLDAEAIDLDPGEEPPR